MLDCLFNHIDHRVDFLRVKLRKNGKGQGFLSRSL